jgi:hypothetical protein
VIRSLSIALLLCLPRVCLADGAGVIPNRLEVAAAEAPGPAGADDPQAAAPSEPERHAAVVQAGGRPDAQDVAVASSEEGATAGEVADVSLERYRTSVETLTERMIGSASKSVRFDWRKSRVAFGVVGSELLERNNFSSARVGVFGRMPIGGGMGELAITRAFTWGSDSTELLGLTPYRQAARPSRFELDVNFGYPVAEGVVTAWPGFFPATELVFSLDAGFRYLVYPSGFRDATFSEVMKSLLAPRLSQRELDQLEESRLAGMQIDPARYGFMAGASLDVYLQNGLFATPRVLVAVPLLAPLNDGGLGWWWELSLSLGWAI